MAARIIVVNAAECRRCGHILRSWHVHDFKTHSCDKFVWFMVDGGRDYIRRGWGNGETPRSLPEDHFIERSVQIDPATYNGCLAGLEPIHDPIV